MNVDARYEFLSQDWLAMQERVVTAALATVSWPESFKFSMIERFDGAEPLPNGMMQGFRIDIEGSDVTFRRGVGSDETADATMVISLSALRALVHLSSYDPAYGATVEGYLQSGDLVRTGAWDRLGPLAGHLSPEVHHRVHQQTL